MRRRKNARQKIFSRAKLFRRTNLVEGRAVGKVVTGTAILTDLDKNTKAMIPTIKQAMAVRVPEGNMAQAQASPVMRKKTRCLLILLVMAKTKKATAVDAMPIPKFAASL